MNAARWAHRRLVRAIGSALATADGHVLLATLAAASGAPVRMTDADKKLVAVTLVGEALPAIQEGDRPLRRLEVLVSAMAGHVDREAFDAFEPTAEDVGFLRATGGAWPATAYLVLRAGACGERQRERPTREQLAILVRAMKQRRTQARKGLRPA